MTKELTPRLEAEYAAQIAILGDGATKSAKLALINALMDENCKGRKQKEAMFAKAIENMQRWTKKKHLQDRLYADVVNSVSYNDVTVDPVQRGVQLHNAYHAGMIEARRQHLSGMSVQMMMNEA